MREQVYHDQNRSLLGTAYCGCEWQWVGRSGGRVEHARCGYEMRGQAQRATRLEWEHVVPAQSFGRQRQCWQRGGRDACRAHDPVFRAMEADMHNLVPAIGETNAERSNFRLGVLPGTLKRHGACDFKVDVQARVVEPRDAVKGMFARTYFYMHDRYDLSMSDAQQRLLMAWDRAFPPTPWERERDRRIARIQGHSNPYVTGEQRWERGRRNSGAGLATPSAADPAEPERHDPATQPRIADPAPGTAVVLGNRRSKVYHLRERCPDYASIAARNRIEFASEDEARTAGYRRARNCR